MPLEPGDKAPAVELLDQHGQPFSLSKSLEQREAPHLIYFYPKADTPGCTTQACGLRDVLAEIGEASVVGISPDEPDRQAAFDEKYGLGFPLLSDPDHAVADAYGVWGEKKLYGKAYMGIIRSAFVVDERGGIAEAWYKISPKDTPAKFVQALAAR